MMDSDSDEYGTIKHSVRISVTFGNNKTIIKKSSADLPDSNRTSASNFQDVEHRNHPSFIGQDETNQQYSKIGNPEVVPRPRGRSFKFVEPQKHKSALFVNLSCSTADNSDNQKNQRSEKQLFISPELNHPTSGDTPPTTSPQAVESFLDSSSYELIDWEEEKKANEKGDAESRERTYSFLDTSSISPEGEPESKVEAGVDCTTMSHGCNFINWMSATRRRASSTAPSAQATLAAEKTKDNGSHENAPSASTTMSNVTADRRASSTDELAQLALPESNLLFSNRSTSANQLGIGASVETVCGSDDTQTNTGLKSSAPRNPSVKPLEIEIDSPQMDKLVSPFSLSDHPVSLDDILKIDMDNMRLEEECKTLEAEAQYWEQKVEELERQQFAADVPRTLVDSIIKHRKELRDLEYEIYKRTLDSEESDAVSCEGKLSQNINWLDDTSPSDLQSPLGNKFVDTQMYYMNDVDCFSNQVVGEIVDNVEGLSLHDTRPPTGKYSPHLKPGQENTADILEAVPPPSSLQRRHYLNKASSGTDTSEYSQLPSFNQHGHKIFRRHQINYQHDGESLVDDSSNYGHQAHHRPRHHHQAQHHHHHHKHQSSSSSSQQRVSRRHVQHRHRHQHQQLYAQVETNAEIGVSGKYSAAVSPNHHRHRASPIRPDHFKGEFRSPQVAVGAHDSSSTPSSSSPQ